MLVRIIKSHRDIITICDSNLLGKQFEEGKFQLNVKESFYKGEEMTKEQTIQAMQKMTQEDASFNIVGKEATQSAIEAGIITKESIKTIQNIPFAMILL